MMKLCAMTALWGRPRVSSIMLDRLAMQRERLACVLELQVVAVGSEGEWSAYLAESHGAKYVACRNDPLGKKWQTALQRARRDEPDAVLVLGSDNLVSDGLLERYVDLLEAGYEYVGLSDAYQYNPHHRTLVHWPGYVGKREGEPIGSGRCFSRALLERLNWSLWEPHYPRGLDYSTTTRLAKTPHRAIQIRMAEERGLAENVHHLGIKIKGAMSPSLHKHHTSSPLPLERLYDWFGEEIGARVLGLGG